MNKTGSSNNIREIARQADVSPATVSRVINGTAAVDPEKRKRVLAAIAQNEYVPNQVARSLFLKSSRILGYIVPNITNPFFGEIGRYLEEVAFARNYRVILCNSNGDIVKEKEYVQTLLSMNADGVVMITNSSKAIYEIPLPCVVIDREFEDNKRVFSVRSDHYSGAQMAAQLLYNKGCKCIVCMSQSEGISSAHLRYQGFVDFCRDHGLPLRAVDCGYSFNSGIASTVELLQKYPEVDGILAANDVAALAVYRVLSERGRQVPQDVKLIGFDNIGISSLVTPALTTVGQPIEAIGRQAANSLIDIIEGQAPKQQNITLPVTLIERDST